MTVTAWRPDIKCAEADRQAGTLHQILNMLGALCTFAVFARDITVAITTCT